jgi:hypothetical protein
MRLCVVRCGRIERDRDSLPTLLAPPALNAEYARILLVNDSQDQLKEQYKPEATLTKSAGTGSMRGRLDPGDLTSWFREREVIGTA